MCTFTTQIFLKIHSTAKEPFEIQKNKTFPHNDNYERERAPDNDDKKNARDDVSQRRRRNRSAFASGAQKQRRRR